MNLLFVGLGSIGRRHLKNAVLELTERKIDFAVDAIRQGRLPLERDISSHIRDVYDGFDRLKHSYDAVFITNPSFCHYETLRRAVPFSRAVFIEKPVFTDIDADIKALGLKPDSVYYVACPLRRSPVIAGVAKLLKSERPTAARAISSSYLPDWRPNADYRGCYSAFSEKGGGVRLDIIHEWDYLVDLFGSPLHVTCESGRFSNLEIESEDTALYLARYSDMLLSLHLDYTGRFTRRELELFFEHETVTADIANNEIRYLRSKERECFSPIDIHRAEMKYFLDLIDGRVSNINTVERAVNTLRLALV